MVAPTLRYDELVVEGDQLLVLVLADELHVVQLLVCERCEEIGLLLKNGMVRALKLLSLRYLRYLSWKAKDAR